MNIVYTNKFKKLFYGLPETIRSKAIEKEVVFKRYPFAKTLKTHKLSGKFSECYAFSINYNYRIIFRYIKKDVIVFMYIGDHSIYQ